jgi:dihydrolipoamide dehydrogenase
VNYDILILGGGPGGYVAAIRAAQLGARTALIEERELGGTCLNRGCIPTKALVESARAFSTARRGAEFGVVCSDVRPDYARMSQRKDEVCTRLRKGVEALLKKSKVDVIAGRGKLADRHTIEVTSGTDVRKVTAHNLVLATGSEPLKLAAFPFDGKSVLTSDDALKLTEIPKSLLVVGGGYIGVEWASIFAELGARVTIVEMMDQLLPRSDTDLAKELFRIFKKSGMDIYLATQVKSVKVGDGGVTCELSNDKSIVADKVLVSVGRAMNSREIGLEAAGVKVERNAIQIDEHCRTNVPNIYAIGDVTGKIQLAHVASRQGIIAAECATGHERKMDYRVVPSCVFTHIEIGSVGMSSAECAAAKREVKEARFPFMALGKALAIGETQGWGKIIADAKSGEVLGVHVIGAHASDLIAEAGLAMAMEATVEEIAHTIHAHPTMPEVFSEAALAWLGRGVHM